MSAVLSANLPGNLPNPASDGAPDAAFAIAHTTAYIADPSTTPSGFAADLLAALGNKPHSISPKYFYDAPGSALFDRICELPEYYPTRTELGILQRNAQAIAQHMGPQAEVVEFGAGSLLKVRVLLEALEAPTRYVPLDISGEHLHAACAALRQDYPGLRVEPLVADYTQAYALPARLPRAGQRVGFFPGSTLGNFTPSEALLFLHHAAQALRGGALLLGVDLVKDPALLHAAYNDAAGVTATFNLNLLARANRELGADFVLAQFAHAAFYNAPLQRIEMHLQSRQRQQVRLCGQVFTLEEGETLHTENSYKYTSAGLLALAQQAGFTPGPAWTDVQNYFSLQYLQAPV